MRNKSLAAAQSLPALRASDTMDLAFHALTDVAINCQSFGPWAAQASRFVNRTLETGTLDYRWLKQDPVTARTDAAGLLGELATHDCYTRAHTSA